MNEHVLERRLSKRNRLYLPWKGLDELGDEPVPGIPLDPNGSIEECRGALKPTLDLAQEDLRVVGVDRDDVTSNLGSQLLRRAQSHNLPAVKQSQPVASEWVTGSNPSILTCPLDGRRRVERILNRVVFPPPFGPSRPKISPFSTENDTPWSAVCGWPPRLGGG